MRISDWSSAVCSSDLRPPAGSVDRRGDRLVDRAREHHLDDLDGFGIGNPQPVYELALDLQPVEHGADLRSAAMHDDGVDTDLLQQHDIAGERFCQPVLAHRMTAVFHDEALAVVLAHIGQRLDEHARLAEQLFGCRRVVVGHLDVPRASGENRRDLSPHFSFPSRPASRPGGQPGSATAASPARSAAMPAPSRALVTSGWGSAAGWDFKVATVASTQAASDAAETLSDFVSTI